MFTGRGSGAQFAVRGRETVEMCRHVERNRRSFHERYSDISRVDGITTEFHLGDGAVTTRIDYPYPPNFPVRASHGSQYFFLPRIDFILVDVAQFADDRIQLSRLVAASRQVDQFPNLELGRGWCLQATVHLVPVGNPALVNKSAP